MCWSIHCLTNLSRKAYWMNHNISISGTSEEGGSVFRIVISIFIRLLMEGLLVRILSFELLVAILLAIFCKKGKSEDKAIWIHYWNMTINYQFPCNIFSIETFGANDRGGGEILTFQHFFFSSERDTSWHLSLGSKNLCVFSCERISTAEILNAKSDEGRKSKKVSFSIHTLDGYYAFS